MRWSCTSDVSLPPPPPHAGEEGVVPPVQCRFRNPPMTVSPDHPLHVKATGGSVTFMEPPGPCMFDNRQDISRRFPLRTSCGQVQYTRAPPDPLWADRPLSPGSPKDGKTPTESRYSPSKSPDSVVPTLRSCALAFMTG